MTTATAAPTGTPPPTGLDRSTKLTITALLVGGLAAILDSTMITLAIRSLASELHSTTSTIQWVTTAYLLALGVAVPLTGWLEARLGGKRTWMAALALFGAASVLCALAWNDTSLIAFRAVQGLGGGLIMPLMQTLAIRSAAGKPTTNLIAMISLPVALGPILGPVIGGVILHWLSWRWLFVVNVPIIAAGLLLAWRWLEGGRPRTDGLAPTTDPNEAPEAAAGSRRAAAPRLDWVGVALLVPALVGILLGLSQTAERGGLGHPEVLIPLVVGIVLLTGFVAWALRADNPLVDVRLMRFRSLGSASAVLFTAGAAMYAGMFLLPLFFQQLSGLTVLGAGLLMIFQGAGALAARFLMGPLVARFGGRTMTIAAFALAALATVPFALAGPDTSLVWLGAVLFVRGLGIGGVLIPPMGMAYRDVGPGDIAHASMNTRIMQQVGASFGTAVVAMVLQFALAHGTGTHAFQVSFWWATGISLLALLPGLTLPGRGGRDSR